MFGQAYQEPQPMQNKCPFLPNLLVFNRAPKTGSSKMSQLILSMAAKNWYKIVRDPSWERRKLDREERVRVS